MSGTQSSLSGIGALLQDLDRLRARYIPNGQVQQQTPQPGQKGQLTNQAQSSSQTSDVVFHSVGTKPAARSLRVRSLLKQLTPNPSSHELDIHDATRTRLFNATPDSHVKADMTRQNRTIQDSESASNELHDQPWQTLQVEDISIPTTISAKLQNNNSHAATGSGSQPQPSLIVNGVSNQGTNTPASTTGTTVSVRDIHLGRHQVVVSSPVVYQTFDVYPDGSITTVHTPTAQSPRTPASPNRLIVEHAESSGNSPVRMSSSPVQVTPRRPVNSMMYASKSLDRNQTPQQQDETMSGQLSNGVNLAYARQNDNGRHETTAGQHQEYDPDVVDEYQQNDVNDLAASTSIFIPYQQLGDDTGCLFNQEPTQNHAAHNLQQEPVSVGKPMQLFNSQDMHDTGVHEEWPPSTRSPLPLSWQQNPVSQLQDPTFNQTIQGQGSNIDSVGGSAAAMEDHEQISSPDAANVQHIFGKYKRAKKLLQLQIQGTDRLRQEMIICKHEKSTLQQQLKDMQETNRKLESKCTSLQKEHTAMAVSYSALQQDHWDLQAKYASLEEEQQKLLETNENVQYAHDQLMELLAEHQSQQARQQQDTDRQLAAADVQLAKLQSQLNYLQEAHNMLITEHEQQHSPHNHGQTYNATNSLPSAGGVHPSFIEAHDDELPSGSQANQLAAEQVSLEQDAELLKDKQQLLAHQEQLESTVNRLENELAAKDQQVHELTDRLLIITQQLQALKTISGLTTPLKSNPAFDSVSEVTPSRSVLKQQKSVAGTPGSVFAARSSSVDQRPSALNSAVEAHGQQDQARQVDEQLATYASQTPGVQDPTLELIPQQGQQVTVISNDHDKADNVVSGGDDDDDVEDRQMLSEELHKAQQAAKDSAQRCEELQMKLDQLTAQLDTARQQTEIVTEFNVQLQSELAATKSELMSLQDENKQLADEHAECAVKEAEQKPGRINQAQDLEENVVGSNAIKQSASGGSNVESSKQEEGESVQGHGNIAAVHLDFDTLQQDYEKLKQQHDAARHHLVTAQQVCQSLQQECQSAYAELEDAYQRLQAANDKVSALQEIQQERDGAVQAAQKIKQMYQKAIQDRDNAFMLAETARVERDAAVQKLTDATAAPGRENNTMAVSAVAHETGIHELAVLDSGSNEIDSQNQLQQPSGTLNTGDEGSCVNEQAVQLDSARQKQVAEPMQGMQALHTAEVSASELATAIAAAEHAEAERQLAVDALEQAKAELAALLAASQTTQHDRDAAVASLQHELNNMNDAHQQLQSECNAAVSALGIAEADRQTAQEQLQTLQEQCELAITERDLAFKAAEEMQAKLRRKCELVNTLKQKCENAESELQEYVQLMSELKDHCQKLTKQADAYQHQQAMLMNQASSIACGLGYDTVSLQKLEGADKQNFAQHGSTATVPHNSARMEAVVHAATTQDASGPDAEQTLMLQNKLADLENQIAEVLSEYASHQDDACQQLKELQASCRAAIAQLAVELAASWSALNADVQALLSDNVALSQQLGQSQSALEEARETVAELEERLETAERDTEAVRQQHGQQAKMVTAVDQPTIAGKADQQVVDASREGAADLQKSESALHDAHHELLVMQSQLEEAVKKAEEAEQEAVSAQDKLQQLQEQIVKVNEQMIASVPESVDETDRKFGTEQPHSIEEQCYMLQQVTERLIHAATQTAALEAQLADTNADAYKQSQLLERQAAEFSSKLETVEKDAGIALLQQKKKVSEAEAMIAQLQIQLKAADARTAAADDIAVTEKQSVQKQQQQISELTGALAESNAQLLARQDAATIAQVEMQQLKDQLASIEVQWQDQSSQITSSISRIDKESSSAKVADQQLQQLQVKLCQAEQLIELLAQQSVDAVRRAEIAETANMETFNKLKISEANMNKLAADLESAIGAVEHAAAESVSLHQQLKEAETWKEDAEDLRNHVAELEALCDEVSRSLATSNSKQQDLQAQLESMTDRAMKLQDKVDTFREREAALREEAGQLAQGLSATEAQLQHQVEVNAQLMLHKARLQVQLEGIPADLTSNCAIAHVQQLSPNTLAHAALQQLPSNSVMAGGRHIDASTPTPTSLQQLPGARGVGKETPNHRYTQDSLPSNSAMLFNGQVGNLNSEPSHGSKLQTSPATLNASAAPSTLPKQSIQQLNITVDSDEEQSAVISVDSFGIPVQASQQQQAKGEVVPMKDSVATARPFPLAASRSKYANSFLKARSIRESNNLATVGRSDITVGGGLKQQVSKAQLALTAEPSVASLKSEMSIDDLDIALKEEMSTVLDDISNHCQQVQRVEHLLDSLEQHVTAGGTTSDLPAALKHVVSVAGYQMLTQLHASMVAAQTEVCRVYDLLTNEPLVGVAYPGKQSQHNASTQGVTGIKSSKSFRSRYNKLGKQQDSQVSNKGSAAAVPKQTASSWRAQFSSRAASYRLQLQRADVRIQAAAHLVNALLSAAQTRAPVSFQHTRESSSRPASPARVWQSPTRQQRQTVHIHVHTSSPQKSPSPQRLTHFHHSTLPDAEQANRFEHMPDQQPLQLHATTATVNVRVHMPHSPSNGPHPTAWQLEDNYKNTPGSANKLDSIQIARSNNRSHALQQELDAYTTASPHRQNRTENSFRDYEDASPQRDDDPIVLPINSNTQQTRTADAGARHSYQQQLGMHALPSTADTLANQRSVMANHGLLAGHTTSEDVRPATGRASGLQARGYGAGNDAANPSMSASRRSGALQQLKALRQAGYTTNKN